MSWGIYWMFYRCPICGRRFKSGADTLSEAAFGRCPACGVEGELTGESGGAVPADATGYEDTAE